MIIYLIGSLRNPNVRIVARVLREAVYEVFDDWHAAGPKADDEWQRYEQARGHSYTQALTGHAAKHVFEYDRFHLRRAAVGVAVYPFGKSGHLEMGYMLGQNKPVFVYMPSNLPDPQRWDVMLLFATGIARTLDELTEWIHDVK